MDNPVPAQVERVTSYSVDDLKKVRRKKKNTGFDKKIILGGATEGSSHLVSVKNNQTVRKG